VAFLTGPNAGDPLAIARAYLAQNKEALGLSGIDIAGAVVTNQYVSSHNGVSHIYLQQQYQGIEVHNAAININIAADGSVISLGNRFVSGIDTAVNSTVPFLTRGEAIAAAAHSLGLDPGKGPVSRNPIPTQLVYQPVAKNLVRLAWELEIYELDAQNWWSMRVDALNGAVLDQKNYVARDSYRVYPVPVESPSHGPRSLITSPADGTASLLDWLDQQCTKGNNVDAYLDTNNSNSPTGGDSARACDAGQVFDFPIDFSNEPNTYQDAAVTNLFYWNNIIHDVFYHYGFDEVSGNFQEDNGVFGGAGSDSVNAEAQDGGGTNNANFATPPDGSNPRMQMFLWNLTSPSRDGDLDNGIIIHEYGHGISVRLTGGPANALCLNNSEQAGEGWSDYFSLLMTIEETDTGADKRGIGTYALGQATGGPGIRDYPYSTDMAIDPRSYDEIKSAAVPHGVGSTWAAMLWEMTWALIAQYGISTDLYNGSAGNNIALQLVVDGLKLQPCSPGFVDARDAILLADQLNNSGANQCLIWDAFSKRGLGFSADQGSSSSRSDGVEAFDVPLICQEILSVTASASPDPVTAGQALNYSLLVQNNTTGTLNSVTAMGDVPEPTSYGPGAAGCGGSEAGGTVTFPLGTMASGASDTCDFQVTVDPTAASEIMADDMEINNGQWIATHGTGSSDWIWSTSNPHSGAGHWFADNVTTSSDQYLTTLSQIAIGARFVMSFWHHYDTEAAWDGGVVEISIDNGNNWTDLCADMIQNACNGIITVNPASPITGRPAFTGDSGGYVNTLIDLGGYAGTSALFRFRFGSDAFVGGNGWYIDDVEIHEDGLVTNTVCVTAAEGDNHCDTVKTLIMPTVGPAAPEIATSPASLAASQNPGVITSQALTIGNTGSDLLSWSVMTDSGGDCSSPNGSLPWASILPPTSGDLDPSASTNVDVRFDSQDRDPGFSDSGALCVSSNDSGNSPITVPLTLTVTDPATTEDQMATGEIPGKGVVSGGYLDTQADDGVSESITEQQQGGRPSNRFDAMEHTWVFQLQSGTGLTFNANAWVTEPADDDDVNHIRLSYSSDDTNYTPFHTVSSSSSDNDIVVPIPDQVAGLFYIKAVDTDRVQGNNNNATLYLDYLSITEGGTPMPPSYIEMTIDNLTDVSELSNRRNRWDAIVQLAVVENVTSKPPVDGAVVSGSWSNGSSGGGSCTTDSSGLCTIRKPSIKLIVPAVTFTVNDVTRGSGDTYVPTNTTVTVSPP
jgi:extracellular elastinolytic metalloproteinase